MLINTYRSGWLLGRTDGGVSSNDVALAAATKSWSLRPTAKTVVLPVGANGIVLAFMATHGSDPDDNSFAYKVFVYFEHGGAEMVCTGTATVGKQQVLSIPYTSDADAASLAKYVDTLASTTDYWLSGVDYADNAGADGMSKLAFDGQGCCELFVELVDVETNSLTVTPIIRVY